MTSFSKFGSYDLKFVSIKTYQSLHISHFHPHFNPSYWTLLLYAKSISYCVHWYVPIEMCLNKGHNEPLIVLNNVYLLLKIIDHFALKNIHETYLILLYFKQIPRSKIQMVHVIRIHDLIFLKIWLKKWKKMGRYQPFVKNR